MNSLERVLATLQGKPVDRRPYTLVLSLYGARLTHCPLKQYYSDPTAFFRGQSAVHELFRPDVLLGPFCLALEAEAFGCQLHHGPDYPPTLRRPVLAGPEQIRDLPLPDLDANPALGYLRQSVRLLHQAYGADTPIAMTQLSPFDLPAMWLGLENWLEVLVSEHPLLPLLLERASSHFVALANAYLADGASLLILPSLVNPRILTRELAQRFALPVLRQAFAQVQGPILMHSAGADMVPFLDLLAGLPNVAGFVLNEGESFADARAIVGPEPVLVGNISGPGLRHCQSEQVLSRCRSLLRDRASDPRFILATSQADIAYDTPAECLAGFRQAAESAGKVG